MTGRGGLGSAFTAAVGDWPATSKRVVRPAVDADEQVPLPVEQAGGLDGPGEQGAVTG